MNKQPENNNLPSPFLKTDGGKSKSNSIETPSISLPKGGGAMDVKIRAIAKSGENRMSY